MTTALPSDRKSTDVLRTLGQRIVAARLAHPERLSQLELARRLNISQKSLSSIERGATVDPRSSIVCRLSVELGVTADWLLNGG